MKRLKAEDCSSGDCLRPIPVFFASRRAKGPVFRELVVMIVLVRTAKAVKMVVLMYRQFVHAV